mgnify:FL=1
MEQRILQYRKQIDEWLAKMEQIVSVSSRDDSNAAQDVQMQAQSEAQNADSEEQNIQEIIRDKLEEHLVQVGFFQHERLIHLIVTFTFALLELLAILLSMIVDSLFTLLLPVVILILLIPYIRHYYILENEVQKMYAQYDRMHRLQQMSVERNHRKTGKQ